MQFIQKMQLNTLITLNYINALLHEVDSWMKHFKSHGENWNKPINPAMMKRQTNQPQSINQLLGYIN